MRRNNTAKGAKLHLRLIVCIMMLSAFTGRAMAQSDPTFVIYSGAYYLAHVYNETTSQWELQGTETFSPNCVWYSSNTHNYYFMDGSTKRYLQTPRSANAAATLTTSEPTDEQLNYRDADYYYYNWDWGLARGYQLEMTGCPINYLSDDRTECWEVFWVEYRGGSWQTSSEPNYNPSALAAQFRVVRVIEHDQEVSNENGGLGNLSLSSPMSYGDNQTLSISISNYSYNLRPAYITYSIGELSNCGTNWVSRTCDTNWIAHNYYNNIDNGTTIPSAPSSATNPASSATYAWTITGDGAAYLSLSDPSAASPTLTYSSHNKSGDKTATVTVTVTYADGSTQVRSAEVTLTTECGHPMQAGDPVVTYEDVTVSWVKTSTDYNVSYREVTSPESSWITVNGVGNVTSYTISGLEYGKNYQYKVEAICASPDPDDAPIYTFTTKATPGVLVYGAIFGGGRMANVNGNTEVVVINCDSVGAVYGGNDIAGQVLGSNGSTITLGVNTGDTYDSYGTTDANIGVTIGSVYGGGNGYYAYDGSTFVAASSSYTSHSVPANGSVNAMNQNQQVGSAVWTNGSTATTLTIPTITKTAIVVNDYVTVDSVFGGAKNAFITNTSGDNTLVTLNGGTIFSVFGGNNIGGTLGSGSNQHVVVNGTSTDFTALNLKNTYTTGFGRDFGVRYLFGGGNKVEGSKVIVDILGGQVDTVFGGGNKASVSGLVNVNVNCVFGTLDPASNWSMYGKTITKSIWSYDDGTGDITFDNTYTWNARGVYNARALFGGNNAADMAQVPTITLQSGSVGTVYGGGNAGRMLANTSGTIGTTSIQYGTHVIMNNPTMLVDYLYGGCQKSDVLYSTWVEIMGGHVGTVYGGCNISGDVGSTRVNTSDELTATNPLYYVVYGGTHVVATGGVVHKDLFAGSNGLYHCNDGVEYVAGVNYDDVEGNYIGLRVPTHNETSVKVSGDVLVYGNVYAGGNLACVGFPSEWANNANHYPVTVGFASVLMDGGTVAGSVYGGGNMASIYGINEVLVSGGTIGGALYGGNDRAGIAGQNSNRPLPADYQVASDGTTSLVAKNVQTYVGVNGTPRINTVYGGGNGDYDYTDNSDIQYCQPLVKPIQTNTFVDINIDGGSSGGYINTVYGGGNGVTVEGSITVFVNVNNPSQYDNIGTIFGGNNKGDLASLPEVILKNGQVNTIYGGCNQGAMTGRSVSAITSGDSSFTDVGSLVRLLDNNTSWVSGAVYGGCRMNRVDYNTLILVEGGNHGNASFYGGSDISGDVGGISRVVVFGGTVGNVYGGGNGNYTYDNANRAVYSGSDLIATGIYSAPYCEDTRVDMLGGTCSYDLYGGGYAGECGDTYLKIDDGTVNGNVYGGGNAAGLTTSSGTATGTSTVVMNNGTVLNSIYGGCNASGNIAGDIEIFINDGTVGTGTGDGIFGGGYGASTTTSGDVTVNIGNANATAVGQCPVITADIYGGSAMGQVNASTSNTTTVNIINGSVTGNIYGGGLGEATLDGNGYIFSVVQSAYVNGNVQVNIGTASQTSPLSTGYYNFVTINGKVFGCNNLAGSPKGTVNVDVYHTDHTAANAYPATEPTDAESITAQAEYAINEVYGGGNLAAYEPTAAAGTYIAPVVHIHNCDNTIQYVYGGGNAATVPATDITIDGGRFEYIFGGGNGNGNGNPGANITDDVNLQMNGGIADYLFGGSNTKGTIGGDKNVEVAQSGTCITPTVANFFFGGNRAPGGGGVVNITDCNFNVRNFYGGGNAAPVTGDLTVNIYGGTYENVFGGCNEADVYGNITLNFYGGTATNIFGGNNSKGQVSGNIVVNVIKDNSVCSAFSVDNVYGGGQEARYGCLSCNPDNGSDSLHAGYPQVNILYTGDSQVNNDVFGGGLGAGAKVYGDPHVTVGGSETITIGSGSSSTTVTRVVTVGNNVYGGGNAAEVNGDTQVTVIGNSTVTGNVYGGGNAAKVTGNTDVQIGQ